MKNLNFKNLDKLPNIFNFNILDKLFEFDATTCQ